MAWYDASAAAMLLLDWHVASSCARVERCTRASSRRPTPDSTTRDRDVVSSCAALSTVSPAQEEGYGIAGMVQQHTSA